MNVSKQNPRPRIVMVVANALTTDVRVQKTAISAALEFEVLVIGISKNLYTENFQLNGVNAITIPWDCWKRDVNEVHTVPTATRGLALVASRRIRNWLTKIRVLRVFRRYFRAVSRLLKKTMSDLAKRLNNRQPKRNIQTLQTEVSWRQVLKDTMSLNIALFPTLDSFKPDIIHVHDVHLLGLVKDYVSQPHAKNIKVIYDAHEYIQGLAIHNPSIQDAFVNMESECISVADEVLTVSEAIAEQIQMDHNLETKPIVILNAPRRVAKEGNSPVEGIRSRLGLEEEVLLAVYSGGVHPIRGIDSLVYALEALQDLHLVLTINREGPYTDHLLELAKSLKVSGRLHFVPFVDPGSVVEYLASANIGVSPLPASIVNFDLALPNKIFDYFQCEIPVVASNCREVTALINELGIGETYDWESPSGLVQALSKVINNLEKYKEPYWLYPSRFSEYTWEIQELKLLEVYESLNQ